MEVDEGTVAEFERAFEFQCKHALLDALGSTSFASAVYYFSKDGLSLLDSARRPAEFEDFLSVLFNPVGAVLLEGRILKRFYHSMGMRFEWNEGRVFKEHVEEAFRQFAKRSLRAPTHNEGGR